MNDSTGDSTRGRGLRSVFAVSALLGTLAAAVAGCTKPSESLSTRAATESLETEGRENSTEEWFNFAAGNLNRFDEFNPAKMLQQIVDRLNRWAKAQTTLPAWRRDPLVDTLPANLRQIPPVQDLEALDFNTTDGEFLREAAWLQSVSRWARGHQADDLVRAGRLFDWTMRNVQVVSPDAIKSLPTGKWLPQFPWQTVLSGEGTALERAWVFILLCRAQGIDAAMLAAAPARPADVPEPWAVGVRMGKNICLFEPVLGLPIPAPQGLRLGESGRLDIVPATLEQAAADDTILRRLDVDGAPPYPIKAHQLKRTVVLMEGSPQYLSRRMKLVEAHLAGEAKLVLAVDASAQAARWKECPLVGDVRLWDLPYATIERQLHARRADRQQQQFLNLPFERGRGPELWKARVRYLRGEFLGDQGAIHSFQAVRPADEDLREIEGRIARQYFEQSRRTRPGQPEATLKKDALSQARLDAMAIVRAKMNATYGLGLIAYQRGDFAEAAEYFGKRTIGHSQKGPWNVGAHYNLGRCCEALGQNHQAIAQYRAVEPPDPGMLLRARWLENTAPKAEPKPTQNKPKS